MFVCLYLNKQVCNFVDGKPRIVVKMKYNIYFI
jgi:hypothetical protein